MVKNKVWISILRQFLAPLGISVCLALAFLWFAKLPFAKTWLGMAADPAPEWYMNMYYNSINGTDICDEGEFPDVVLLDIKESITRKELASLLAIVSEASPKIVGVDCAFPASESYDTTQTNALIQSISRLPGTPIFVFADVLGEKSAIPDSIIAYRGFVNGQEPNRYDAYRNGIPHFSYEIARLAGYNVNRIDTSSFLVNYRKKAFASLPIYSDFREEKSYIQKQIQNKIVIIGGLNNRLDMHYTPFVIEEENAMISGSRLLAYMLSSVITAADPKNYSDCETFHYYSRCPLWINALLTIIFILCYLGLYILIEKIKSKYNWVDLLKPILLFVMIVLIVYLSMKITEKCFYVPYVAFFMVLTLFIGFSYDICNFASDSTTTKNSDITTPKHKQNKEQNKINWGLIKREEGYIVMVVCYVFNLLRYVSLFQSIREANRYICCRLGKDAGKSFFGGHNFPELWVVCNMLCGIIMYALLVYVQVPCMLGWIFVALAILRAFEIMVYHVNVLLFDPLIAHSKGQEYAIKSPTRMLVLLLCNMFEYVLCFSIVYLFCVEGMNASYWQSFTMSISAFLNIDAPSATQNLLSNTWVAVARVESILGVFMNLICIARFINALPGVDTMNSKKA